MEDVHTEGRGYDLDARRNSQIRHVEVKGVIGSAASDGIRMTGNEVLIATQHRKDVLALRRRPVRRRDRAASSARTRIPPHCSPPT